MVNLSILIGMEKYTELGSGLGLNVFAVHFLFEFESL